MEFWFEFASTYSYPAAMRIEQLAERAGVELAWRPFLLGPIFAEQGWNTSPFNIYPAKGRYMWRDLERICMRQGIAFRRPSVFPRNGLLAARVSCALEGRSALREFVRRVYSANFVEDREISEPSVIAELLAGLGLDPDATLERAQSPEVKLRLRELSEQAVQRGIFGAPSICVGDELFWGNDRLEQAFEWQPAE